MSESAYLTAFAAGMLSFVSPCVLPLVPAYLGFITGVGYNGLRDADASTRMRRILPMALAFVLGFSTVFIGLGAAASALGRAISKYFDHFAVVAGFILIALGVHLTGLLHVTALMREWRPDVVSRPAGLFGSYVVGAAFGFGWTPCVGPVLAGILLIASTAETVGHGSLLLAAYSGGLGAPFLVVAIFTSQALKMLDRVKPMMRGVEIGAGTVLIITGLLIATGLMARASTWLYEMFPVFSGVG